jgi:DNA-binding NtrC family response regulator
MPTDLTLKATVLVVDDIAANRNILRETLEQEAYEVLMVGKGQKAIEVAGKARPDVILLDVLMPEMDGFETCRRLKQDPDIQDIPVIFISAQNETESMVEGFRSGGVDYITKPFKSEEVLARVRTHLTNHRLTREILEKNRELEEANEKLLSEINRREKAEDSLELADAQLSLISEQETERWGLEAFVGRSLAMQKVIADIRRLQPVDRTNVLIRGESGTGKELIARALHFSGKRSGKPFIAVNCAAIPGELAESLFFGHVKGAFSGANQDRKGYFETASGGTLFLDEVGDMPLSLQPKLLRVLEDGCFLPVGGQKERRTDVRVVAATNANLAEKIQNGSFRQDLYYRIVGYDIELQPLRERREDVELLTAHFLHRFALELGRITPSLSENAWKALMDYAFPGNVRELKSILERATIESPAGIIDARQLRLQQPSEAQGLSQVETESGSHGADPELPDNLEEAEFILTRRALTKAGGNMSKAAKLLGINRTKIYRILSRGEDGKTANG